MDDCSRPLSTDEINIRLLTAIFKSNLFIAEKLCVTLEEKNKLEKIERDVWYD